MKGLTKENANKVLMAVVAQPATKFAVGGLFSVYSFFFDPVKTHLYAATATLIIFDFITAIISTFYTKEKITSANASRTLTKLAVYGILVSAATLTDRFILETGQVFADLTLGTIAVTEFISIIENIGKMGYVGALKLLKRISEKQK